MELDIFDVLLGLLTILSFVLAFVSEEYRILAIIFAFILMVLIALSKQNKKIGEIKFNQRRLSERLKIYEMFIDMKSDIKELQREVLKNGKRR